MPADTLRVVESGYLAPRQVIAGPGASRSCGHSLLTWGVPRGRAVVIADRVVAEAGLLDSVLSGLAEAGFTPDVFAEINGEPDADVTTRASDLARSANAVAVIGVGGGSAMDVAKVVALLLTNAGEVGDWLGVVAPAVPVAPLVLVPSTTGTGAEATRISMITVGGLKRILSCIQFVPLLAVLDDDLVAGLPAHVVASTGMDALAHGVESILSTNRSSFTLAAATRAITMLRVDLEPAVLGDPGARARVLYAAHLAGLALNAGVVVGHSLAYVIARHAPMSHGTSCALALPYCLAYNRSVEEPLADHLAHAITGNPAARLELATEHVGSLAERLDQPRSLEKVGIGEAEIESMAGETVTDYPRPNNPVPLERDALRSLLDHMRVGDLAAAWRSDGGRTA